MASLLLPSTSTAKTNNLKQPHCCSIQSTNALSFRFHSHAKSTLQFSAKGLRCNRSHSTLVKAQLNELEGSKTEKKDVKKANEPTPMSFASEASISEFMTQVSSLVKLVDSRDVAELQLRQSDCELLIRKKEALPQPSVPDNAIMMHSPSPAAVTPPASAPVPASTPPPVSSPTQAPAPSPPSGKAKSSHLPLKCPMAGTFYRCPGPGEPPFVKVGDKVQKGQVVCIIEAMKLMNEIEADRSGTIVEVLVDDGKPVSVDTPLFVIEP